MADQDDGDGDPVRNAEVISDILHRRFSVLGISISSILSFPPLHEADVVFHVSPPQDPVSGTPQDHTFRLLAHSSVLRKGSDYFREILDDFALATSPDVDASIDHDPTLPSASGEDPCYLPDFGSSSSVPECPPDAFVSPSVNMPFVCQPDADVAASMDFGSEGAMSLTVSNGGASTASCSVSSAGEVRDRIDSEEQQSASSTSGEATETTDFRSSSSVTGSGVIETDPSVGNTTLMPVQGTSSSESDVTDAKTLLHQFPRRSILLPNTPRKSLSSGRRESLPGSRKSVRFSIDPADIITSMKLCQDSTGDQDKHMEEHSVNLDDVATVDPTKQENEPSIKCADAAMADQAKYTEEPSSNPDDPFRITYINKPMIKRRYTEVNIVSEKKNDDTALQYYVVKKHGWTAPVLIGILEWLYLGSAHINIVDIDAFYNAAYRAALSSLTWCIRKHPIADYLNLALINYPVYCQSLLDLCLIADCKELSSLKSFCQALKAIAGTPKIAIFETKSIVGRAQNFPPEGFLVLDGHPICVLAGKKSEEDGGISAEQQAQSCEPDPFLTFESAARLSVSSKPTVEKMFRKFSNGNKEQTWRLILLDNDPAGSLYAFFNYVTVCNLMGTTKRTLRDIRVTQHEKFKFQMITKFKLGTILVKALRKSIKEGLMIREERGAGTYIKGSSYCTSLVLEGDPVKILLAANAIPYEMMGRCALEIRAPTLRTFYNLFYACNTFGVDLRSHNIVLVKPLYVIIKILEYMTKLNTDAYEAPEIQRTMVELIEPTLLV